MGSASESAIPTFFQNSVVETFSVQVQLPVTLASSNAEGPDAPKADIHCDCMSVLGLKCDQFTGSLAIGFPAKTFLAILERMIGEKHAAISPQNVDACSELLNIIYASARVKINEAGFRFEPAIPTTITGKDLALALSSLSKTLKLTYESECGPFILALSLKRAKST